MDAIGYVYVREDGKTYYPDTVEKQLKNFRRSTVCRQWGFTSCVTPIAAGC